MINCDLADKGFEEIDRKRRAISRIIGSLHSCVCQTKTKIKRDEKYNLKSGGGFIDFYADYNLSIFIRNAGNVPWHNGGSFISALHVPLVYSMLPEIIECLHDNFPEAKIEEHFKFFVSQAPK